MEVLCCPPLLPSALPSDGYVREGGGVGFGRCPARVGVGHGQGPYAGLATRAGRDPARNLNEWPPGLARRGPRPGEVGKAHGADRPQRRAAHRPTLRRRFAVGLALAVRARPVFFALPVAAALPLRGLVAGRSAVAEPRAGGRPCRARPASAGRLEDVEKCASGLKVRELPTRIDLDKAA